METSYHFSGQDFGGKLSLPTRGTDWPGILVLHGGGGLGEHAKQTASRLAQDGYAAYAPDLFGTVVNGLDQAHAKTEAFLDDWQALCARCDAALAVLQSQPGVDADRIGIVGICFGGQVALEYARSGKEVRAVIGFHPRLATRHPEHSERIRARVLVCLGDQDRFVDTDERDSFLADMTSSGIDCQMLLFAGVMHSFTDPFAASSGIPGLKYDERASRRSWASMLRLFNEAF